MKFETNVTEVVRGVAYVTNHHYVKLTDKDNKSSTCFARGLLRCACTRCHETFYVETNLGSMTCPHCGGDARTVWGRMQLSFVPERESSLTFESEK